MATAAVRVQRRHTSHAEFVLICCHLEFITLPAARMARPKISFHYNTCFQEEMQVPPGIPWAFWPLLQNSFPKSPRFWLGSLLLAACFQVGDTFFRTGAPFLNAAASCFRSGKALITRLENKLPSVRRPVCPCFGKQKKPPPSHKEDESPKLPRYHFLLHNSVPLCQGLP